MYKDKNKNALFLLPIFQKTLKFYGKEFENIYIDKESNNLKIVFEEIPLEPIRNYIENLEGYIKSEEFKGGVIYEVSIPEKFYKDLIKYQNGKYSQFSKDFKQIIIRLNPKLAYDLGAILFPKAEDRKALELRLDAKLPKNSEIYDIIDRQEYYSDSIIRRKLGTKNRRRVQEEISNKD